VSQFVVTTLLSCTFLAKILKFGANRLILELFQSLIEFKFAITFPPSTKPVVMWLVLSNVWLPISATVAFALIALKAYTKLTAGRCTCATSLIGCTALITGATGGIGRETAVRLAAAGARLVIPVRSEQRGRSLAEYIGRVTGNKTVQVLTCDLSSLRSVRQFCAQVSQFESRLDLLVLNAGMVPPPGRFYTEDGLELQLASNHFGHFLLLNLLLPLMRRTASSHCRGDLQQFKTSSNQCSAHIQPLSNPRIVVVSSLLHRLGKVRTEELSGRVEPITRDPFWNYCDSKLANLLMVRSLSDQLRAEGSPITINGLHPGMVKTEINRQTPFYVKHVIEPIAGCWAKDAQQGAQTTLHLCLSPSLAQVSGRYFVDCKPVSWSSQCDNQRLAADFWALSERLTGLKESEQARQIDRFQSI
jgi:NAD(P)-dependent dehydrogenase (short-subunit alcohol dehydrogenase family)